MHSSHSQQPLPFATGGCTAATHVELQLLALEHVAVAAAALAGPRGDARVQPARGKLLIQRRVHNVALGPHLDPAQ